MLAGMAIGSAEVAVLGFSGMVAFSHNWSANNLTLNSGVVIYPAVITNQSGLEVPMFTRCQRYLASFLSAYGNELTKKAIADGSIIWNPVTYYIRAAITGLSGRQKVLGSATSKVLGICNLDKGILPQYYNFCYDRIAARYGTTAVTATDSPASLAGYSSVRSSMPAGLSNAELIISLNRQVQLETPVSDFTSVAAVTGGGSRDFDGGELQVPKVWQENLQVDAEINLPLAIPSAVNTSYFLELQFYGVEARLS